MTQKAPGTDGWAASALFKLLTAAWKRLLGLLEIIESQGQWPTALHEWRICFYQK